MFSSTEPVYDRIYQWNLQRYHRLSVFNHNVQDLFATNKDKLVKVMSTHIGAWNEIAQFIETEFVDFPLSLSQKFDNVKKKYDTLKKNKFNGYKDFMDSINEFSEWAKQWNTLFFVFAAFTKFYPYSIEKSVKEAIDIQLNSVGAKFFLGDLSATTTLNEYFRSLKEFKDKETEIINKLSKLAREHKDCQERLNKINKLILIIKEKDHTIQNSIYQTMAQINRQFEPWRIYLSEYDMLGDRIYNPLLSCTIFNTDSNNNNEHATKENQNIRNSIVSFINNVTLQEFYDEEITKILILLFDLHVTYTLQTYIAKSISNQDIVVTAEKRTLIKSRDAILAAFIEMKDLFKDPIIIEEIKKLHELQSPVDHKTLMGFAPNSDARTIRSAHREIVREASDCDDLEKTAYQAGLS